MIDKVRKKLNWNRALIFAAFLFAVVAIHSAFLNNPFVHDDIGSIVINPNLSHLDDIPDFFVHPSMFSYFYATDLYRPVLLTTYAVNYAVSGLNPWSWRAFNLVLLALNAFLLALLLEKGGLERRKSVLAGALFLFHPISGYCFRLVSTRSALLMFMFILLGVIIHLKAFKSGRWRYPLVGLAIICMALGLLSVSAAIIFPAVILLIEGKKLGKNPLTVIKRVAPYALVAGAYLVFRKAVLGRTLGGDYVRPFFVNLGVQAKAWWLYLKESLYPFRMEIYPGVESPENLAIVALILALAGLLLWVFIGCRWWLSEKFSTRGILLLSAPVTYLPYALIPLNVPVAYHHFYPSLGALAGLAAMAVERGGRRFLVPAGLVLLCFAALNVKHDLQWRSQLQWAANAVRQSPESARSWNELGQAYYSKEDYHKAIMGYNMALQRDRSLVDIYHNLAGALFRAEKYEDALSALKYFKKHGSKTGMSLFVEGEIGMTLVRAGRPEEGLAYLERALEKFPHDPKLLTHKAMALGDMGKIKEAKNLYSWIFKNYSGYPEAMKGRIRLALSTGDTATAFDVLEAAEEVHGLDPDLAHLHAAAYMQYGLPEEAVKVLQRARKRFPNEISLWLHEGKILRNTGKYKEALKTYRQALEQNFSTGSKERIKRIIENLEKE